MCKTGHNAAKNLTAQDPGTTPGVGVLKVLESGRDARFESIAPVTNRDAGGVERADVHAMTVRLKK